MATTLSTDARQIVRDAASALDATGRHAGAGSTLRVTAQHAEPPTLLAMIYRLGGRIAADLDGLVDHDDLDMIERVAEAHDKLAAAHAAVVGCLAAPVRPQTRTAPLEMDDSLRAALAAGVRS